MSSPLLSPCPVCGGAVSTNALECPHCGERLVGNPALPGDAHQLRKELENLKAERRRQNMLGFAFGIPGLLLQIGSGALAAVQDVPPAVVLLVRLLGIVLLVVGIGFVAAYKGRNPAWSLVGLLGCIGLILIAVLKDFKAGRIKEIEAALSAAGRPVT